MSSSRPSTRWASASTPDTSPLDEREIPPPTRVNGTTEGSRVWSGAAAYSGIRTLYASNATVVAVAE